MQKRIVIGVAATAALMASVMGCEKSEPAAEGAAPQTQEQAPAAAAAGVESDVVAMPPPPKDTDTVAQVGDAILTYGALNKQVDEMIEASKKLYGQDIPSEQLPQAKQLFRRQMTQQFIVENVLAQAAKAAGVTVDDAFRAEKTKELEARQGQKLEDLLKSFPLGEEKARAMLENQFLEQKLLETKVFPTVKVSDEEIQAELDKVAAQTKLVSDEMAGYAKQLADGSATFEDLVKANSLVKSATTFPADQLPQMFPDKAAQEALASVKEGGVTGVLDIPGAKAIFKVVKRTPAKPADEAAAKAKAEELRARLIKGEDFAKLAQENSDCPSGQRGGDLPPFSKGDMVKPFEDAAFSQKIGEIGPVVKTDFGYHIIKVTARDEKAGTATASHILIDARAKPASVELLPLIKQAPMPIDAKTLRDQLTEQRKREAAMNFFNEQKRALKVSCPLFPELGAAPEQPKAPAAQQPLPVAQPAQPAPVDKPEK